MLLAACGGGGDDEAPEREAVAGPPAGLERGCKPPRAVLDLPEPSERKLAMARKGVFSVYGFRTRLVPPVDWGMDPHQSARFQAYLSNWDFIDVLLGGYAASADPKLLRQAAELALDWVAANPRHAPAGGEGTWSGKITGDRAPRLAYLLRASRCARALRPEERRTLNASLQEHIDILMGPESEGDTNHALYVQLGIAAVMKQLPGFPGAEEILARARERFERVLTGRLREGVWLEHSTSYQFLAIRVVERFMRWAGEDAALRRRLAQMKRAAAWLTAPDGRHTLLGDSRMLKAPEDIRALAEGSQGMRVFRRAGLAAVREGGSHLVIAAGFHNTTHKHADELTFELAENGRRLITDTGMYHKDPGEIRDFVVSAAAHNTLTADGESFPAHREGRAYGSGILAAGTGEGWYAVLARNPLLRRQDVRHHRLFLYRPGEALIVIDRARSPSAHHYERHLHFAPAVNVSETGRGRLVFAGRGLAGEVAFEPGLDVERARGQRDPLAGYMARDYRDWSPRTSVTLGEQASTATRALTVALGQSGLRARDPEWRRGRIGVTVRGADGTQTLELVRSGGRLEVEVKG